MIRALVVDDEALAREGIRSRAFRATAAPLNPPGTRITVSSLPIMAVTEGVCSASDSIRE
jgi:hypothetical protein